MISQVDPDAQSVRSIRTSRSESVHVRDTDNEDYGNLCDIGMRFGALVGKKRGKRDRLLFKIVPEQGHIPPSRHAWCGPEMGHIQQSGKV